MHAVLFDMWDTLVWAAWFELNAKLAALAGVDPLTLAGAFASTRRDRNEGRYPDPISSIVAVLQAAGVERAPQRAAELVAQQRSFEMTDVHLFEDSLDVLRELRARGVKTAVVSNCDHLTRPVIERLGLDTETDALVLSCELRAAKPDPRIYQAALAALDVAATDALFVDDQPGYCDGAAALGLATRLILRPEARPAEGVAADARGHTVITDLRALL